MPEIEITPEQRDRLRSLQEDIARDVVGKYGHVRPKDAIEYLLDQYEGDESADAVDGQAAVDTVESADDDAAGESTADATEADPPDDAGNADPSDDSGDADATGGEAVARVVGDDPESDSGGDESANGEATDAAEGATTSTGEGTETTGESAGGDSMLDAMLSLLETHDDKWNESSAADERYAVELPDGDTEHVRTKDDVKALLFKHYR